MTGFGTQIERLADDTIIASVEGELDLATTPFFEYKLRVELTSQQPKTVIVDLTACEFADSSALAALVRTSKHLDGAAPLGLVIPQPGLLRIFEITHLDGLMNIYPTREAALNDRQSAATT